MKTQIFVAGVLLVAIFFAYNEKKKSTNFPDINKEIPSWKVNPTPSTPVSVNSTKPKSYEEALQIASKNKQNVFLFFGASWCAACKKMKSDVLADAKVQEELKKYVFYEVNTDAERTVADKFKLVSIPSCLVVDPSERLIKSQTGYMKVPEFLKWLKDSKTSMISKILK